MDGEQFQRWLALILDGDGSRQVSLLGLLLDRRDPAITAQGLELMRAFYPSAAAQKEFFRQILDRGAWDRYPWLPLLLASGDATLGAVQLEYKLWACDCAGELLHHLPDSREQELLSSILPILRGALRGELDEGEGLSALERYPELHYPSDWREHRAAELYKTMYYPDYSYLFAKSVAYQIARSDLAPYSAFSPLQRILGWLSPAVRRWRRELKKREIEARQRQRDLLIARCDRLIDEA